MPLRRPEVHPDHDPEVPRVGQRAELPDGPERGHLPLHGNERAGNTVTERETADALLRADALLSTQPRERKVEDGQFGDSGGPPPATR
jgi:hypothetical protein